MVGKDFKEAKVDAGDEGEKIEKINRYKNKRHKTTRSLFRFRHVLRLSPSTRRDNLCTLFSGGMLHGVPERNTPSRVLGVLLV